MNKFNKKPKIVEHSMVGSILCDVKKSNIIYLLDQNNADVIFDGCTTREGLDKFRVDIDNYDINIIDIATYDPLLKIFELRARIHKDKNLSSSLYKEVVYDDSLMMYDFIITDRKTILRMFCKIKEEGE